MRTEPAKRTRSRKPVVKRKSVPLDKHAANTAVAAKPKPKQELHPKMKERMWKKGQPSPNPAGRPKYKTLSESLRHFLEQPVGKGKDANTTAEAIAIEILKRARGQRSKADVRAFEAVRDTVEGKPAQRVEIQGGGVETKERERQVRFLSHTVKQTREELGAKVTVEEIWTVVEEREKIMGEDVTGLREAVIASVIGDGT